MMNRDKLILDNMNIIDMYLSKYKRKNDEDLHSIGTIALIEAVDYCIKNNKTKDNEIKAIISTYVRNKILNEIYKEKPNLVYDETILANIEAPKDCDELYRDIRDSLSGIELTVFDKLVFGYTKEEIMKELSISRAWFFKVLKKIKEEISRLNQ